MLLSSILSLSFSFHFNLYLQLQHFVIRVCLLTVLPFRGVVVFVCMLVSLLLLPLYHSACGLLPISCASSYVLSVGSLWATTERTAAQAVEKEAAVGKRQREWMRMDIS